jgi:hypothetical protein
MKYILYKISKEMQEQFDNTYKRAKCRENPLTALTMICHIALRNLSLMLYKMSAIHVMVAI